MTVGFDCVARRRGLRAVLTTAATFSLLYHVSAFAQLSTESFWPKFQRDAQNSGYAPVLGYAGDPHVVWAVRLSDPIPVGVGEHHATPVFSLDNTRAYVGGPASTLTAVDVAAARVAWTLQLGDGTGHIFQTAVVGADGTIYVGAWDTQAPFDGFNKIRDEGDHATVVWTFPMAQLLASPTITRDGLIVVGGRHDTEGWGYYGLKDLGDTYQLVWIAARFAEPGNPASTGWIGSSPALSPDGTWLFGGSYRNRTFWQIDAASGAEAARIRLDYYCYSPSPVVSDDGFAFVGEGMSFTTPDDKTQGKLYAFEPDPQGVMALLDKLALGVGHLNGGTAALHRRSDGRLRLYVPANGYTKPNAQLVALDFDPDGPHSNPPRPALVKAWQVSIGPAALAYPQAVVTRDELVCVIGPGDHVLYGVRDGGSRAATPWTLALSAITRVKDWQPGTQRGPQGVVGGPDGMLYWNAVDGYLYAIHGWPTGDLDGDERLTDTDLDWLVVMLLDLEQYRRRFPEIDAGSIGDVNGDGRLDFFDLLRMLELLG